MRQFPYAFKWLLIRGSFYFNLPSQFYAILTILSYLKPNALYTYISNIYDLVWFGLVWFYGISTIVGYLMLNPIYTYILNIYDLVWLGFMIHQHCRLLKTKCSLNIYIEYMICKHILLITFFNKLDFFLLT